VPIHNTQGKVKGIPVQAWTGTEDFRRLRLALIGTRHILHFSRFRVKTTCTFFHIPGLLQVDGTFVTWP
jgi:hypothetical protein